MSAPVGLALGVVAVLCVAVYVGLMVYFFR